VIYDLLVRSSGPLELREDPDQGVCVAGLKHIQVTSAAEIMVGVLLTCTCEGATGELGSRNHGGRGKGFWGAVGLTSAAEIMVSVL
jgi:hypothetical protein